MARGRRYREEVYQQKTRRAYRDQPPGGQPRGDPPVEVSEPSTHRKTPAIPVDGEGRVGFEPTAPQFGVESLSGRGLRAVLDDSPSSATLSLASPASLVPRKTLKHGAGPTSRNGFCDAGSYLSQERPAMSQRRKTRSHHTGNIKTPTVRCST